MKLHFYKCEICGKIIAVLYGEDVPTKCCGEVMKKLVPNRTDVSSEKHVPVIKESGNTVNVQVGSELHPMTDRHLITWIGLKTAKGFQFKELKPGDRPVASFSLTPDDRPEAAYAFCNLHGLWAYEM